MKKTSENICKFVPYASDNRIVTSNFVYETGREVCDKMQIRRNSTINIAVSGKGYLHNKFGKNELAAGTVFFTFAEEPFHIENSDEFIYMYITFLGQRSKELFDRYGISPIRCCFKGHEGLISFWQSCIGKANEKNLDLLSESVLLYTFSQLSVLPNGAERRTTDDILEYIEAHFADFSLSLSSVADALGYNPKYISKIFKESTGITFTEYLKNTRIQHAEFLMDQGITSVKNVAFLSGYNDPFYFSNVFKQITGMAPSEYINRKNDEKDEIKN